MSVGCALTTRVRHHNRLRRCVTLSKIAPYGMDNLFFGIPLCKGLPSEALLKIISGLCNYVPKKANSFTAILLKKLCDANREIKVFVAYNRQPPLKCVLQRRLLLGYEVLSIATVIGHWSLVIDFGLMTNDYDSIIPPPNTFSPSYQTAA